MTAALQCWELVSVYMCSPLPMQRFLQIGKKKGKKKRGGKRKKKKKGKHADSHKTPNSPSDVPPLPSTCLPNLGWASRSEQKDPKKVGRPAGPSAAKSWFGVFEHWWDNRTRGQEDSDPRAVTMQSLWTWGCGQGQRHFTDNNKNKEKASHFFFTRCSVQGLHFAVIICTNSVEEKEQWRV